MILKAALKTGIACEIYDTKNIYITLSHIKI